MKPLCVKRRGQRTKINTLRYETNIVSKKRMYKNKGGFVKKNSPVLSIKKFQLRYDLAVKKIERT